MSIWLHDEHSGHVIEIDLSAEVVAALRSQWDRADRLGYEDELAARLSRALNDQLERILDSDLRPPTRQQIAFAKAISNRLNVPLSSATLSSRASIGVFLDAYSEQFKRAIKRP